jgi:hypothetical protein
MPNDTYEIDRASLQTLCDALGRKDHFTGLPVTLAQSVYVAWRGPDNALITEMLMSMHSWNSYSGQLVDQLGKPTMYLDGTLYRRPRPVTERKPKPKVVKLDPFYRVSLVKKPKDNIVLFGILK